MLADNQAIQFPVMELMTQVEMLRLFILKTSWEMDRMVAVSRVSGSKVPPWVKIERKLSDQVSMCNFWANRLRCQAADRAIQVSIGYPPRLLKGKADSIHGGDGYSRHYPL